MNIFKKTILGLVSVLSLVGTANAGIPGARDSDFNKLVHAQEHDVFRLLCEVGGRYQVVDRLQVDDLKRTASGNVEIEADSEVWGKEPVDTVIRVYAHEGKMQIARTMTLRNKQGKKIRNIEIERINIEADTTDTNARYVGASSSTRRNQMSFVTSCFLDYNEKF